MKKYYTLIYSRGENWNENENWDKQDLMAHGNFMAQLHKEGKLVLGGPFDDASGGQSVLEVDSIDEAQAIVDQDPAIINKVFDVVIRPWYIAFKK
ncbi:MAG: hypothetical protein INQ03_22535 [Candidatus Heimdallarchaeota archaeon]|nr:hypothetical protein [Candidatus Heimdallarchaeota archaeon]